MKLSIIIPTLGRPTLARTLLSLKDQLREGDEVLVVGDGLRLAAADIVQTFGDGHVRYMHGPATGQWGHAQRTLGMYRASGDYLSFMDDDDTYLPNALDTLRRVAQESPKGMYLFRMKYRDKVLWERPKVQFGNVSTQMVLLKNEPPKFGRWAPNPNFREGRGGDFIFIQETASRFGDVTFREEVIAELIAHSSGRL